MAIQGGCKLICGTEIVLCATGSGSKYSTSSGGLYGLVQMSALQLYIHIYMGFMNIHM